MLCTASTATGRRRARRTCCSRCAERTRSSRSLAREAARRGRRSTTLVRACPRPTGSDRRPRRRRAAVLRASALLGHVRAVAGRDALSVDVHLWVRELTRIDRAAAPTPRVPWGDDGPPVGAAATPRTCRPSFPAIYCRHCGRSGWGVALAPVGTTSPSTTTTSAATTRPGRAGSGRCCYAPAEADAGLDAGERRSTGWRWFSVRDRELLTDVAEDDPDLRDGWILPVLTNVGADADERARNDTCPSCGQEDGIRFLGSAIATLLSVSLSTLFGSPTSTPREKKTLVFTDWCRTPRTGPGSCRPARTRSPCASVLRDAVGRRRADPRRAGRRGDPAGRRRPVRALPASSPPDCADRRVVRPVLAGDDAARVPRRGAVAGPQAARARRGAGVRAQLAHRPHARTHRLASPSRSRPASPRGWPASPARPCRDRRGRQPLGSDGATGDATLVQWVRGVLERMRAQGAIDHPWFDQYRADDGVRLRSGAAGPAARACPRSRRDRPAPGYPRSAAPPAGSDASLDAGHLRAVLVRPLDGASARRQPAPTAGGSPGCCSTGSPATACSPRRPASPAPRSTRSRRPASSSPRPSAADLAAGRHLLVCDTCRAHDPGHAADGRPARPERRACMVRCRGRLAPRSAGRQLLPPPLRLPRHAPGRRPRAHQPARRRDPPRVRGRVQGTRRPARRRPTSSSPRPPWRWASTSATCRRCCSRRCRAPSRPTCSASAGRPAHRQRAQPRLRHRPRRAAAQARRPAVGHQRRGPAAGDVPDAQRRSCAGSTSRPSSTASPATRGAPHPRTRSRSDRVQRAGHLPRRPRSPTPSRAPTSTWPRSLAAFDDLPDRGRDRAARLAATRRRAEDQRLRRARARGQPAVAADRRDAEPAADEIDELCPTSRHRSQSPAATDDDQQALRSAEATRKLTARPARPPARRVLDQRAGGVRAAAQLHPARRHRHPRRRPVLDRPRHRRATSTDSAQFQRGSAQALREFAPGATFYARGWEIAIDAVDLGLDGAVDPHLGVLPGLRVRRRRRRDRQRTARAVVPALRQHRHRRHRPAARRRRADPRLRRGAPRRGGDLRPARRARPRRRSRSSPPPTSTPRSITAPVVRRRTPASGCTYLRAVDLRWINLGVRRPRRDPHHRRRRAHRARCSGSAPAAASSTPTPAATGRTSTGRGARTGPPPTRTPSTVALSRTLRTQGLLIRLPRRGHPRRRLRRAQPRRGVAARPARADRRAPRPHPRRARGRPDAVRRHRQPRRAPAARRRARRHRLPRRASPTPSGCATCSSWPGSGSATASAATRSASPATGACCRSPHPAPSGASRGPSADRHLRTLLGLARRRRVSRRGDLDRD